MFAFTAEVTYSKENGLVEITATITYLRQIPTHWIIEPENPNDDPIEISKIECPKYPMLGEFVGRG